MIELTILALSLGALCQEAFRISALQTSIVGILAGLAFLVLFPAKRALLYVIVIAFAFFIGGMLIYTKEQPRIAYGPQSVSGKVASIDRRIEKTVIVLREDEKNIKIQFSLPHTKLLPGDRVRVRGMVKEPEDFITDSGRIFKYGAYLESKGIDALMDKPAVEKVQEGSFTPIRLATQLRHGIASIFAKHVSFPVDGILSGMLVGYQGAISEDITTLFRDTGVLHVLVLSGYNITLFAGMLAMLLRSFPPRMRVFLTVVFILLLVLISGSGIAAMRAGLMGTLSLWAGLAFRAYNPMRALLLAFAFFFLISPNTVFYDPGFHLSFLASFFMIAVLPKVMVWFLYIPETKYISLRELIVLACSMPMFMLPYTMYFSGLFPISGIPANILLALATPLLMASGIAILILSFLHPLANSIGAVTSLLGEYMLHILEAFHMLPIWNTPPLSWRGVLGIYGISTAILFRKEISNYARQLQSALQPRSNSSEPGSP